MKLNPTIKAASRREALDIILSVRPASGQTDTALAPEDWQRLLLFFGPKAPAKAKTAAEWVAKAVGKKDKRDYLNYLYSDGSRLIATDGHRVHLSAFTDGEFPAGYYCPRTLEPVDKTEEYAPIDRILSNVTGLSAEAEFDLSACPTESINGTARRIQQLAAGSVSHWFQKEYLDQAANGEGRITAALSDRKGVAVAVAGSNEFGRFYIMPWAK